VLVTIDRKAIANQDFMGITVAEGRLSRSDDVFRERDFSLVALAFAKACADFAFPIFDDPLGVSVRSGAAELKSWRLGRTHRFRISFNADLVV
jgi:hypothetical protein